MKLSFYIYLFLIGAILIIFFNSCEKPIDPKIFPPSQHCPGVSDVEYHGEVYPTVQIGEQCWLAKNLNVGNQLSHLEQSSNNDSIEKYCYNNLESNCNIYGGLYRWDEMMEYSTLEKSRGICPEGWHVPSKDEFMKLYLYVDGCTIYLESDDPINGSTENEYCEGCVGKTGFNLLYKNIMFTDVERSNPFGYVKYSTVLWTSMQYFAWFQRNSFSINYIDDPENAAYYVRCIKDHNK